MLAGCAQSIAYVQVVSWLCCKVKKLQQALKDSASGQAFQGMDDLQLAAYCIALLSEYVQDFWLAKLRELCNVTSQGTGSYVNLTSKSCMPGAAC